MAIATVAEFESWAAERGIELSGELETAMFIAEHDFLNVRYKFKDGVTNEHKKPALFQAAYQHTVGRLFVDITNLSELGMVESESKSLRGLSKSVAYRAGSQKTHLYDVSQIDALVRGLLAGGGMGQFSRW